MITLFMIIFPTSKDPGIFRIIYDLEILKHDSNVFNRPFEGMGSVGPVLEHGSVEYSRGLPCQFLHPSFQKLGVYVVSLVEYSQNTATIL